MENTSIRKYRLTKWVSPRSPQLQTPGVYPIMDTGSTSVSWQSEFSFSWLLVIAGFAPIVNDLMGHEYILLQSRSSSKVGPTLYVLCVYFQGADSVFPPPPSLFHPASFAFAPLPSQGANWAVKWWSSNRISPVLHHLAEAEYSSPL